MSTIITAVVSVTGIGALSAIILTVASKVMAVAVDERFPIVREELPGANCGACGYAGCDAYAQALIDNPDVKTNLCVPGGSACAAKLAEALGREFEAVAPKQAIIRCTGTLDKTSDKVEFQGFDTCKAAKFFYGGTGNCTFGCLGCGDCAVACPYDAIDVYNGIAHINTDLCVGCGACVKVCPAHIIDIVPKGAAVFVGCSSCEKGAVVRKICSIGCIACKKCERECPVDAIKVENNIANIDYDKCVNCGHCARICMTGCIKERW